MRWSYFSMDLLMAAVMAVLLGSCAFAFRKKEHRRRILPAMLVSDVVMLLADAGRNYFILQNHLALTRLFYCICQVSYYAILILFVYDLTSYISAKKTISRLPARLNAAVCIVSAVLWLVSAFNGMIYDLAAGARGAVYWVGQLGGIYMMFTQLGLQLRHRKVFRRGDFIIYLCFFLCPVVLFAVRSFVPDAELMSVALSVSILLLYEFVHLEQLRHSQETELLLSEAKLSVMTNQTRPHFLYNTLNSIYYLCEKDPITAQKAVRDFAEYLRGNMESMEATATVSFEKEMEHVEHYLSLEKLRFQDELKIEYDLNATAFQLPPLSVQMMVENAVKHGIEMKPDGGSVRIRSWETQEAFFVSVADDGVGFDPGTQADGMGITITKQRLESRCGGTLTLESAPGKGTTATICIPKQDGGKTK